MCKAEVVCHSPCVVLSNARGVRVRLTQVGAAIVEVIAPDAKNRFQNIALSLPLSRYGKDPSYAGATLGPHAGRVPGGALRLGGRVQQLSQNEGKNHLHGGFHNVSAATWEVLAHGSAAHDAYVTFGLSLPDQQDGYPGLRHVSVRYQLDDDNRLHIQFAGDTDQPTHFNFSNHCYWNLSGDGHTSALRQRLQLNASRVWYNDGDFLPTDALDVSNTPFDFRSPAIIAERLAGPPDPQLQANAGYNHSFLLNKQQPAAILHDPPSGRLLKLFTDYPCVQLYTGGFLGQSTVLAGGVPATPGCGIALEPQERPITPQQQVAPVLPGETWRRNICFAMETQPT